MNQSGSRSKEIIAIITTDEKLINNGKAPMLVCQDETEQKKITREVALALKGDVVRLSNGIYLVIPT